MQNKLIKYNSKLYTMKRILLSLIVLLCNLGFVFS
jgi:hypothetical protein